MSGLEFSTPPPATESGALSPAQRRAQGLKEVLHQALQAPEAQLAKVKGNLLLHIPGVATWTLVTAGPRKGLHDAAGDDEVHFALCCRDEVMLQLFTDSSQLDLPGLIAKGKLQLEGDVKVFSRLIDVLAGG